MQRYCTKERYWKQSNFDCMSVFVEALRVLHELARERVQLKQMIQSIVEKLIESEYEAEIQRQKEEELREKEKEEKMRAQFANDNDLRVHKTAVCEEEMPCPSSGVFLYGPDAERIEILLQDVLKETVLAVTGIELIKIDGRNVGGISIDKFCSILSEKYGRCNNPHRTIIILEDFTTSMFLNFKRSGFVNANRAKGKRISTICWSSRPESQHEGIKREFSNRVYVPNGKEGAERKTHAVNPNVVAAAVAAQGEKSYPKVQQGTSGSAKEKTGNQEKGHSAPVVAPVAENTAGTYVQVQQTNRANNDPRSTRTDPELGQHETTANHNINLYTEMQPVRKTPVPPTSFHRPVTMEPKNAPEPYTSGLGQTVKKKSDAVKIGIPDEIKPQEKPHEMEPEEKNHSDGLSCEKVVNCIIGTFACLFD